MSDDRMVIRADARAIGAVTALSSKAAPRWRASKRPKTEPCFIVTRALNTDHRLAPTTQLREFSAPRVPRDITGQPTRKRDLSKQDKVRAAIMDMKPTNDGNRDN